MISTKLLSLPLFQGISQSDLREIMGYTRFDFKKHAQGKLIAKSGDRCEELICVLDGEVEAMTATSDNSFIIHETIEAPLQLQSERIIGLNQLYTSTFHAHTICHTMSISKDEFIKLYNGYDVVRINLLNNIATRLQRAENQLWRSSDESLRQRLLRYITSHCLHPAGEKDIHTTMNALARELNESRLNISIELNRLQTENLLTLSRSRIHIPTLEKMFFVN